MSRPFFLSSEIWISAYNVSEIIRDICVRIDEKALEISPFAEGIESVGIIVNCHPERNIINGWGKPRKYINYKKGYADIRLPIPYDDFVSASYEKQFLMVVKNIVDSIKVIEEKCNKSKKAKFDSEGLIKLFLSKLELSEDDINNIKGVISDEEYRNIMTREL